jgi:hypothetical protein
MVHMSRPSAVMKKDIRTINSPFARGRVATLSHWSRCRTKAGHILIRGNRRASDA